MRIIAGTARSLPLKTLEGIDTRPTTDRIKETLFNMIQNDVQGAKFLDLFCGSGQIGLEALSRGAAFAVFVENNKKAVAIVDENIRFTKFGERSRLLSMDVIAALRTLEGNDTFDYIYMDPPYQQGLEKNVLKSLLETSLLNEDTVIIIEAALDTDFSYLDELGYQIIRQKNYKTNMHLFVNKKH